MNDYEKIIKHINNIKNGLKSNLYCSGEDLEKDFYRINELTGLRNNNVKYKNLDDIFKVHEFLIAKICKIHSMENDSFNQELLRKHINIKKANEYLKDGKRTCGIYSFNNSEYEYFIIGDLHSDTISLKRILQICDFFNVIVKNQKKRLIFLGDYVDRGKAHIKILEFILALKFLFPDAIYLLKGNHDDGMIVKKEVKLCIKKPEDESDEEYFLLYINNLINTNKTSNNSIIETYLDFFNSLCNIAFVNNESTSLLLVHGGIPRPKKNNFKFYDYINNIADLTNDTIIDYIKKTIRNNMLWSDPCEDESNLRESSGRFGFTINHFNEFQNKIGFDLLIRGHQAEKKGYKKFFGDKLFTIFSSGIILENGININNETAYKEVTPKIFHLKDGQASLLDLNKVL